MDWVLTDANLAALFGATGGLVLGLAARLGRFCTLGAIEDFLYGDSDHRLRMWGLAIGVAVLASFGLGALGYVDLESTPYLRESWNPIAHLLGGLLFGAGMAMAGNCGYGAVARLGGGDMRAFVIVTVMGIAAFVTMSGPLARLRTWIFPDDLFATAGPAGYAHMVAGFTGLTPAVIGLALGAVILVVSLASGSFLRRPAMVFWGAAVGLVIGLSWCAMTWLADYSFGAVTMRNHTFAAPLGETILYAMTASGTTLSFGIGGVAGVWAGALVGSIIKGHFRWEACEDVRELRRQLFGAALMGGGAVLAMGCSVGQGLSAMSVLSLGAPLTLVGIFVGTAFGLRSLLMGFHAV